MVSDLRAQTLAHRASIENPNDPKAIVRTFHTVSLPPIDALQCFLAASRTLNFRAAAQAMALSPAAFSDRIRHLEEHLGVRLFHRTSRSVRLTEIGLVLVPRAEHAIAASALCGAVATGEGRKPVMDLVIGTRHELGMSWLLPALPALRA